MGYSVRLSLLLFALCSALDEMVTFRNLSWGGIEFNPRVMWLISISPLLYPLADLALISVTWGVDRLLVKRRIDLWLIWMAAGIGRLMCFIFSLVH